MSEPQPTSPPVPAEQKRRFGWVRAAGDRVPTKWFAGIATALFLAATAAFGGLAAAAVPPPEELAVGEAHVNDQLSITVQRAVLIDELADAGVSFEPGERVLALVVDVENRWTRPLSTAAGESVRDAVGIDRLAGIPAEAVARYDDATNAPWLQPGVPATLVLSWAVDADEFADGDELQLTISDETLYSGSFVLDPELQYWTDPVPAATVTVPVTDVGSGADAGADE